MRERRARRARARVRGRVSTASSASARESSHAARSRAVITVGLGLRLGLSVRVRAPGHGMGPAGSARGRGPRRRMTGERTAALRCSSLLCYGGSERVRAHRAQRPRMRPLRALRLSYSGWEPPSGGVQRWAGRCCCRSSWLHLCGRAWVIRYTSRVYNGLPPAAARRARAALGRLLRLIIRSRCRWRAVRAPPEAPALALALTRRRRRRGRAGRRWRRAPCRRARRRPCR